MSIDNGKPNAFRVHADKPEGEILSGGAIQDAAGVIHQRPATGWPAKGISYVGGWPEGIQLGTDVASNFAARGLVTIEGADVVVRPSRPNPDVDANGSAKVADRHLVADRDNALGMPMPHAFPQAERITFHDPGGDVTYDVTRQPDKYVAGDTEGTERVTAEVYAAGDTEVEWFYTLTRTEKKG